ncbi:MAG: hypothetical protein LBK42_11105 [Propionibacteriaceae bacterium]|nr:hypothetical protein [Propionibacteriaceae bacterium]
MTELLNLYRQGVVSRRWASEADEDVLSAALASVLRVFGAPAWVSPRARQVYAELYDLRWSAHAAAQEVDDLFADVVRAQPEMVDVSEWRSRWTRW